MCFYLYSVNSQLLSSDSSKALLSSPGNILGGKKLRLPFLIIASYLPGISPRDKQAYLCVVQASRFPPMPEFGGLRYPDYGLKHNRPPAVAALYFDTGRTLAYRGRAAGTSENTETRAS